MRVRPPGIPRPPRTPVWGVMEKLIVLNPGDATDPDSPDTRVSFRHGNNRWYGGFTNPWWVTKRNFAGVGRECTSKVIDYVRLEGASGGDYFRVQADGGNVRISVRYTTDAPHGSPRANGEISKNVASSMSIPTIIGGYRVTGAIVTMELFPPRTSAGLKCGDGIKSIAAGGRRQKTPYPA